MKRSTIFSEFCLYMTPVRKPETETYLRLKGTGFWRFSKREENSQEIGAIGFMAFLESLEAEM